MTIQMSQQVGTVCSTESDEGSLGNILHEYIFYAVYLNIKFGNQISLWDIFTVQDF